MLTCFLCQIYMKNFILILKLKLSSNLLVFGLLLLGCQPLIAQDKAIETSGDILLFSLPVMALTGSLIAKDYEGTWQFTKGALLNQGVTIGLKYALNKDRPYGNGERAFPSGHTSTTFQSAAFIQKRYGWKYGIPAYALAGFTGYSRINAQAHDGWDVLAGAVVGVSSAYLFTTPYAQEHFDISLKTGAGSYQLGLIYNF
ncbi:phosphoesterase PA-phosphatase related protein [Cellulophaga algicola DSM 14237]|uniref:Phosphoesterase PA-phosphatase related protein n=2 Tax=Cellulophaga TaxID=104264 RepID=E6XDG2_CELAD|nr:phosphoesterase PA-phosphatase related protein [Cellulophaga algicola DSM 14237]